MSNIIVTGGLSGLGAAIVEELRQCRHSVLSYDLQHGGDVRTATKESVLELTEFFPMPGQLDVLINCAGVNIIDWLQNFTDEQWDQVMDVNAKGIFKMTQACLPMLIDRQGTVVNIVSNAAHMPMTCSLAYNASKGAAHIMTLQLARELTKKYGITVFGVAPNKLNGTGMSDSIDEQVTKTRGWTKDYAQQYQLSGLLTGEETPPFAVAEFLAYLLSSKERHKYLTGTVIPYGA